MELRLMCPGVMSATTKSRQRNLAMRDRDGALFLARAHEGLSNYDRRGKFEAFLGFRCQQSVVNKSQ
jgi:hypothetical protein